MARFRVGLAGLIAALVSSACHGNPTGSQEGRSDVYNLAGPSGLEQHLSLAVDPQEFRIPGGHSLVIASTIKNNASVPVRVASRICRFLDSDFESTASLDRVDPLATCGGVQQLGDLAPGASIGPLTQRFLIRSGPGSYRIAVRHALDPEFRTEASFQIP